MSRIKFTVGFRDFFSEDVAKLVG